MMDTRKKCGSMTIGCFYRQLVILNRAYYTRLYQKVGCIFFCAQQSLISASKGTLTWGISVIGVTLMTFVPSANGNRVPSHDLDGQQCENCNPQELTLVANNDRPTLAYSRRRRQQRATTLNESFLWTVTLSPNSRHHPQVPSCSYLSTPAINFTKFNISLHVKQK